MSVRAGIVVTGTEVLSGIVADRNGPWLSERLRERGWRVTSQRRAVAEALAGEHVHLTADEVHRRARDVLPEGLATRGCRVDVLPLAQFRNRELHVAEVNFQRGA